MTGNTDSTLGNRATLRIDPESAQASLWDHPLGSSISFTYIDFEGGFSEESSPQWNQVAVLGRGEPYQVFEGTSQRDITLNITFVNQTGDIDREVIQPARFLDALKYPIYNGSQGITYPPPPCILQLGSLLMARVILTSGSPTWRGPVDPETLKPHVCEFSATFTIVRRMGTDLGYRHDGQWV